MATGDSRKSLRHDSSLISYMLLLDVVQALHFDFIPNYSSQELFIDMPGSPHAFRNVYSSLLHGCALPQDITTREDALLLLVAILGDAIRAQKTGSLPHEMQKSLRDQNPYTPVTVKWETNRIEAVLEAALARWRTHFTDLPHDVLALYHFARLHLLFPEVAKLAHQAGYPEGHRQTTAKGFDPVPEEAVQLAWQVLEESEACPTNTSPHISIWLPIVVFYSALTIAKSAENSGHAKTCGGQSRMLAVFVHELERLRWPCCAVMSSTLNKLMSASRK